MDNKRVTLIKKSNKYPELDTNVIYSVLEEDDARYKVSNSGIWYPKWIFTMYRK